MNPAKSMFRTLSALPKALLILSRASWSPRALGNLFQLAIDGRKKCTQWYIEHVHGDEDKDSNQRHAHFTDVLAATWEILHPLEEACSARVKSPPVVSSKPHRPIAGMVNRFSGLHIELPSEQDSESLPISQEDADYKLTDTIPVVIVKSEEDIRDEFLFAIFSFF
jgi:hypothetical protein